MDLISLAVPFFLLLIVIEWMADRFRRTGYFRLQDALGSLSAGGFNSTTGIFSKLIVIGIYGFVLEHFAVFRMPAEWFDLSPGGIAAWIAVLIWWDFMYYWKHRIGHEVSLFWAAHSVHHQSEEYNLTTALRQTSSDFIAGWVIYLPMFVAGVPVHVFATVSALDLIYQFWVHTRHIDKLGWVDRVFVTPSNHRVHHAQNTAYIDKNYGGILIIWDRLFGTYAEERDDDPVVFGVRKPLASFNPVVANLQVYRYLWFDARRTRRWRDKLGVWFRRTGWRPADMHEKFPAPARDARSFQKFSAPLNRWAIAYLVVQFILALALTIVIGGLATSMDWPALLLISLTLWLLLASLGMLSDGSAAGRSVEVARLLLVLPMAAWLATMSPDLSLTELLPGLSVYVIASLLVIFSLPIYRKRVSARPSMRQPIAESGHTSG